MKIMLIDDSDIRIKSLLKAIERLQVALSEIRGNLKNPLLNGEIYLTDKKVCERLHTTRQTIQDWRNKGQISYFHLGGKILYRESDIQAMLEKRYRKAWK